jgi:hypothetical protein
VNPKWHFKIKHYNVEIVAKTSSGQHQSKNSINRRALKTLQFDVHHADKLKSNAWMADDMEVETVTDHDNRSRLRVLTAESRTQFHSNRKAIVLFFVEIVSKNNDKHNTL